MYEVESRTGGYLSLGRLTAKVGKKGEGRGERRVEGERETSRGKSTINNRQSSISLSSLPSPLSPVHHPHSHRQGRRSRHRVRRRGRSVGRERGARVRGQGRVAARPIVPTRKARRWSAWERTSRLGWSSARTVLPGWFARPAEPSDFVRQMPRRVRIKMFNTGMNLKEGDRDPHWQLVARSDDPKFKPRPAVVTETADHPPGVQPARPFAVDFGGRRRRGSCPTASSTPFARRSI